MTIFLQKKEELSLVYWLKGLFPGVNVVDEFPDSILSLPTISVDWDDLTGYQIELGNRHLAEERTWYIDIFCETKEKRKDYAYKIFNDLQEGVPVYDYDMGFPPGVSPTQLGSIIPMSLRIRKINPVPELIDELYWRATIILVATYDKF